MRILLVIVLVLSCSISVSRGHNITKILADHPEFSTFNHYLTATHLAPAINSRLTITVLAVDNAGMSAILAKHLPIYTLKNVLALHILVDYYGAKKLHQLTGGTAVSSSMFQATGAAPGTTGFVNITDHRAGKVSFAAADDAAAGAPPASFVKSVKEIPYNISVIQISTALSSPEAEAPTPAPTPVNLTTLMSKKSCKLFAGLLISHPDVQKMFDDNLDSGLTAFCPTDAAISAFMPKYKNLTTEGKSSLLLYHGVPVYNSIQTLKSSNGVVNTLATDRKNYNYTVQDQGEVVTLETRVVTAKITGTLVDEDPVAVFAIDKVLEPSELFKTVEADAPADAPEPAHKKKGKGKAAVAPAGPEESPADQVAADDENAGGRLGVRRWVAAAAVWVVVVLMV